MPRSQHICIADRTDLKHNIRRVRLCSRGVAAMLTQPADNPTSKHGFASIVRRGLLPALLPALCLFGCTAADSPHTPAESTQTAPEPPFEQLAVSGPLLSDARANQARAEVLTPEAYGSNWPYVTEETEVPTKQLRDAQAHWAAAAEGYAASLAADEPEPDKLRSSRMDLHHAMLTSATLLVVIGRREKDLSVLASAMQLLDQPLLQASVLVGDSNFSSHSSSQIIALRAIILREEGLARQKPDALSAAARLFREAAAMNGGNKGPHPEIYALEYMRTLLALARMTGDPAPLAQVEDTSRRIRGSWLSALWGVDGTIRSDAQAMAREAKILRAELSKPGARGTVAGSREAPDS